MNISSSQSGPESLALYIHLPFCKQKCAYCDFPSYAGREASIPIYLHHLLMEWAVAQRVLFHGNLPKIVSCYFGGGTPSLLSESQITTLVTGLFPHGIPENAEVTLEANPESLDEKKLACYRRIGINRLSVGIQSFSDPVLTRLGRVHSGRQARNALNLLRKNGWTNVSLDLMYGLPEQTPDTFEHDLDQALAFEFPHFSAYCLTLAPGTPLENAVSKSETSLPEEEDILAMMQRLEEKAGRAGYGHYEISNFAKPGHECRHNLAYWTLSPYLGLGAGAVSYLPVPSSPWGSHHENPRSIEAYIGLARQGTWSFLNRTPLTRQQVLVETLLTGLRLSSGVSVPTLTARFGKAAIRQLLERARPLEEGSWIIRDGEHLKATPAGSRLLDTLILELIPPG